MATRADRNNNPTNIKVPAGGLEVACKRYGDANISIDPSPASDGGQFLKFSTPEYGKQATSTLLKTGYSDMDLDSAMKRWSGGGYGADVAPNLGNKKIGEMSDEEMNSLSESMAKREGYTGSVASSSNSSNMFGIKTANAQTNQSNTKSMQDQLKENIDAMEQQGAPREVIQSYLDDIGKKSTGNNVTQTTQEPEFPFKTQADTATETGTTSTEVPTTQTGEPTLVSELSQRGTDITKAISDAQSGKISGFSGGLQAVGAVAGGLGDLVDSGLNFLTGGLLHKGEDLLGEGITHLAETPIGQNIVGTMQKFQQEHPELAGDIGAGFNIVTAIPILKGLSVLGKVVTSSLGKVVVKGVINGAKKDIETVVGKEITHASAKELLEKEVLSVQKQAFGREKGKLVWKVDDVNAKKISNTAAQEVGDLSRMNNVPYTPGKIAQSLEKGATTAGTAIGFGVGGGLVGGAEGMAGGWAAKKVFQGLYKKVISEASRKANRTLPSTKKVTRGSSGLLGGVMAQKN